MRPQTEAPPPPRRPEDDWPAFVLVVLWLSSLAVGAVVGAAHAAGQAGVRVACTAERSWRALVSWTPRFAQGVRTASRRGAAALGQVAGRSVRRFRRLIESWWGWGVPQSRALVAAGRRLDWWAARTAGRSWQVVTARAPLLAKWLRIETRRGATALRHVAGVWLRSVRVSVDGWWAWCVPQGRALVAAGWRFDREAARIARRFAGDLGGWMRSRRGRRIGRALRRTAIASTVLMAAVWSLSAPALRLGADVFADEVADQGLPPLEQSSVVVGSNGEALTAMPGGPHRRQVTLDKVPDFLPEMVVAVEDARFWDHEGWDATGIIRAAFTNASAGEVEQGGSTISQQLAKQSFAGSERTVVRKGKELLYAVALEERYSKRQLLERYLNEVYLGSGAYGVAAAAEEYFDVPVTELSKDQAALLVGLIPSPTALDPRHNPDGALTRRNLVLRVAAERGALSPEEARRLQATPLELTPSPVQVTDPLLAAAVRRELLADPGLGADRDARAVRIATGGLRIETSIDGRFQTAALDAVRQGLQRWPGLSGALAAVDPHTGAVRAMASVTPPGTKGFDLATQGRRQPGSTFKPLAAVAALEAGIDPSRPLEGDGPAVFEHQPGQRWTVENYGQRDHGPVTLDEALTSSINTAFAELAVDVGTPAIVDVAERVGIDIDEATGEQDQRGPSIALGALSHGVSPLEMASAYGFLATGGAHAQAHLVTRVTAPDGRVLIERPGQLEPAVDPAITGTVRTMLQDVIEHGTGRAADLDGWRPAGKTGTSQNNADAWFVGTIPTLSVATWLGHPDAAQPVPQLTGGTAAAPIWRDFVAAATEGTEPVPFPDPPPAQIDPSLPALERGDNAHDDPATTELAETPTSDLHRSGDGRPGRGRGRSGGRGR